MSRTKLILITALVLINVVCLAFLLIQGDKRVPDGVYVTPAVLDLGKVKDTRRGLSASQRQPSVRPNSRFPSGRRRPKTGSSQRTPGTGRVDEGDDPS